MQSKKQMTDTMKLAHREPMAGVARAVVASIVVGMSMFAGGCASEAEPGSDDSNVESADTAKAFETLGGASGDGINGTAKSRSNTCGITQGTYLNKNKLYVKCTQSGGSICNGTLTIPLSERGQLQLQEQNFNPSVSIDKNQGWVAQDGITCLKGTVKLKVTMDSRLQNVTAISLNGSPYTFAASN